MRPHEDGNYDMESQFTNHQCAAKGCVNTRDQGSFVGRFCSPCDAALVTGEAKNGTSWIFALAAELAETKRALAVVQDTSIAHAGKQSDLLERTLKEGYDIQARQRDRIRELEAALRYWLPELNEIDVAAEEYERWKHDSELLAPSETSLSPTSPSADHPDSSQGDSSAGTGGRSSLETPVESLPEHEHTWAEDGRCLYCQYPLCSDCPPVGYPTDETRCATCPRRKETIPEPTDVERKSEPEHQAQMKWARDVLSNVIIPPASGTPANPQPETMRITYELVGRCLWHEDCDKSTCGIMREERRDAERSLVRCLHCGRAGYLPVGSTSVCVAVESQQRVETDEGGCRYHLYHVIDAPCTCLPNDRGEKR